MCTTNELLKQSWDAHQVSAKDDAFELLHEAVRELANTQPQGDPTLHRLRELNICERLYGVEQLCRNGEWHRIKTCIAEIRSDIAGLSLLADRDVSSANGRDEGRAGLNQPKHSDT